MSVCMPANETAKMAVYVRRKTDVCEKSSALNKHTNTFSVGVSLILRSRDLFLIHNDCVSAFERVEEGFGKRK